MSENKSPKEHF